MISSDNQIEAKAKKLIAIKDFTLLSTPGVVGAYKECELTHIYLFEIESNKIYHYYAVLSYEEYIESNEDFKEIFLTPKPIKINNKYKLGIKQSRLSFNCAKDIFNGLCTGYLSVENKTFCISSAFTVLPKTHIPSYWDNNVPLLHKVLKPNFWGDNYIIEFFSTQNPFDGLLSSKDFTIINENIKKYINIDLESINDRIGSYVFQFPITLINADIHSKRDWCNAEYSIQTYPPFIKEKDIISIISTELDNVITGCNNIEGVCKNHLFEVGDSNNFKLLVINKENKLIYRHLKGNYLRYFNFGGGIGFYNSEPRTFTNSDNEEISIDLFSNNFDSGNLSNGNYSERIRRRMKHNNVIKASGEFAIFINERKEALFYIRDLIQKKYNDVSEIWMLDPYLLSKDIIDTLYYHTQRDIKFKCITSYKKSKLLIEPQVVKESSFFYIFKWFFKLFKTEKRKSRNYYFKKYKSEQKNYFLTHSNNLGIILEYRVTHENIGFDFHDRFLFFIPKEADGIPTAYSLGTSVNSLGKAHHIIQKVPDSKELVNTFQELWKMLDNESSLIIKLPEDRNCEK